MLQKFTAPFRQFGVSTGLLYAIDRALQRFSPRLRLYAYDLMVQPIGAKPLVPARLVKRFEIREIKRGDPELARMPPSAAIIESRYAQNAICLGAFQQNQFIGYIWFCFTSYEEDEVRCTYVLSPAAEAVFDFDLYIYPEHRIGLAFAGLWNGANQFLSKRGIKYTFSRLTKFNLASRRSHDRLGWKLVGRVIFLQAWRLEIMAATTYPYLHASWRMANRAHLRLRPDALLYAK